MVLEWFVLTTNFQLISGYSITYATLNLIVCMVGVHRIQIRIRIRPDLR